MIYEYGMRLRYFSSEKVRNYPKKYCPYLSMILKSKVLLHFECKKIDYDWKKRSS